jgi:hypothetical protein
MHKARDTAGFVKEKTSVVKEKTLDVTHILCRRKYSQCAKDKLSETYN